MKERTTRAKQRKPAASRAMLRGRAPLQRAIAAHRRGDLDVAERMYRSLLMQAPANADALHFLGVLLHRRGHSDEAVEKVGAALAVVPDYPDAHNNLGNIHKECGRLDEAEACYRRALACSVAHPNAMSNLAVVLECRDRPEEAFEAYGKLIHMAPGAGRSYWMMGRFLMRHPESRQHLEEAAACFRRALEIDGPKGGVLHDLGNVLYALEQPEEARQVHLEWLRREPDNPVPRHMLAACGGAEVPARATDAYVRETFDKFAASFDEQLLQRLDYRAPQVIVAALQKGLGDDAAGLAILDAGCGTGLCGPLLRGMAARLVGVDLSSGMLEMAARRKLYDELVAAELTAFIEATPRAWDAIVSADTLVYFGDLEPVCRAAHAALHDGGWFCFSLKAREGDGFELSPSGRYVHGGVYAERVLRAAGFVDIDIARDGLRMERGKPVPSWVVRARCGRRGAKTTIEGARQ